MDSPTHRDRIAGGLLGLLIGDALGVPFEFKRPEQLPPIEQIDFVLPDGFARAHDGTPLATWSDDGAQALCLLASLLHARRFDIGDFSRRLLDWADHGYLAIDNRVFDMGIQTHYALKALREGASPRASGPAHEMANGNGSLMRVLPLALWHRGDDDELIAMATEQSLPTHGHIRSHICCAMLCLWARQLLRRSASAWDEAADAVRRNSERRDAAWRDELDRVLAPTNRRKASGSGYVVDTLWSARIALEEGGDFAGVVRRAIAFGHDTDTTAAVAGGLAGIRYGAAGIPASWRAQLRGSDLVGPLLNQLLDL